MEDHPGERTEDRRGERTEDRPGERTEEDRSLDRFRRALETALDRVAANREPFGDGFPEPASGRDLTYDRTGDPLTGWTPSFWTGQCWLAAECGDGAAGDLAASHLDAFERRLDAGDVLTHDLGFLYTLSAWAQYDVTGSERARQVALRAADALADRFHLEPGVVQAWGDHRPGASDGEHYGWTIVDCMMNLPLLYRAAEETGYDRYREVAATHARTTAEYAVREDGTTPHCYGFDVETGAFLGERTHQGYADDSCWARGQAWTVYGFPLSYRYTGDGRLREAARTVADRFLAELPDDRVPPWDFRAGEDPELRDSSAAAIAACGLLELAEHLPRAAPDRRRYEDEALAILDSLASDYAIGSGTGGNEGNRGRNDVAGDGVHGNDADGDGVDGGGSDGDVDGGTGLLRAGAYNWHEDSVEECTLWGDYFYLEGLVRATRDWEPYWYS